MTNHNIFNMSRACISKACIFVIFYFLSHSFGYTNPPNNKNKNKNVFRKELRKQLQEKQQNLQKNIEIYQSIKECNVSEINSCGDKCSVCLGKGVLICDYCHGTGFLTMGDIIIGTGNNCTVCMGKGEKECKRCMGSGYIARWRK